jgi:tetratricopeptide (TPR) repeat protein
MSLLRVRHSSDNGVEHVVSMEFEGRVEERRFSFELTPQDRQDLQEPFDTTAENAERIAGRIEEIGEQLFRFLFDGSAIRGDIREHLGNTRIEIMSEGGIPWELLRDPAKAVLLACAARSFVRRSAEAASESPSPADGEGALRVLLVECGPVARRLVEGLREETAVELGILRPLIWEQLSSELRSSQVHLVQFEGSGPGKADAASLGALLAETTTGAIVGDATLAETLSNAGAPGIIALPANAAVETTVTFLADLYQRLLQGASLGEAATFARRQWTENGGSGWSVPLVFESGPLACLPAQEEAAALTLQPYGSAQVEGLPPRPVTGFFGRDETLRALDRAFDTNPVVLLHGDAGSGKTTAAIEFARWYQLSGGVNGALLVTTFAHHLPLARVLEQIGYAFGPSMRQVGVHWPALDNAQRRQVALDVLRQVPVLWIWDNVELIAGFPRGSASDWTSEEQQELFEFLREARETGARFLITSRGIEEDWLGGDVEHILLPALAPAERPDLALACADRYNRRLPEAEQLRPLLDFTEGNPLAIGLVTGQVMRDGLRANAEFQAFAARLRESEIAAEDVTPERVTRPLMASVNYVFAHAFEEAEFPRLDLLQLFHGLLHVDTFRAMGQAGAHAIAGLDHDDATRLLERAAVAGLLIAYGGGYYAIHPSLAWYFRRRFDASDPELRGSAIRAYAEAVGASATFYSDRYANGDRAAFDALRADQPNLLRARALARHFGNWRALLGIMQGLKILYQQAGRDLEWRQMVDEIAPEFVAPETGGAVSGHEEQWNQVTGYRVEMAQAERRWDEAARLQQLRVDWLREQVGSDKGRERALAIALGTYGQIQREAGKAECVRSLREAFDIVSVLGDRALTAIGAFDLGRTYEAAGDWDQAEDWYRKSMAVCPEDDHVVRPKILSQLGGLSYERFARSLKEGAPAAEHLENTARFYHQALELTPPDAVQYRAVIHNQLGNTYYEAGDAEQALDHYRQSIECKESSGQGHAAASTRYNAALLLLDTQRFEEAIEYANAALEEFERHGPAAARDVQKVGELIQEIRKAASA